MTNPADPRTIAEIHLDGLSPKCECTTCTLARALIEALDNYQFMVDRAANEKLDGYRELGARAAAAENDRDALLADLPHALKTCGCVRTLNPLDSWPNAHTAAIERLEARIK